MASHPAGRWSQIGNQFGSYVAYQYTANLAFEDADGTPIDPPGASDDTRLEVSFFLFQNQTDIVAGDISFSALPSQAKFSISLFSWPWMNRGGCESNKLELRMQIEPLFSSFTRERDDEGVTTFIISGQYPDDTRTQLRMIDAATIDGRAVNSGGIDYELSSDTSELVIRFRFFNSSLIYDPGTSDDGDGDDD